MTFPLGPHYVNLLLTISLLYGRWSTSGSDRGNLHFLPLQEYNRGNRRKKKQQTNNMLGVNSSAEGELCNTLCMCRLTLVWILAKLPQSNWNANSIFFHWSGPYLLPTGLSAPVSGFDCLVRGPAPTANFELLCPTNSLFMSPSTSGHGEISSPKPFVWFRAKTDKVIVCLAGHLHSVTNDFSIKMCWKSPRKVLSMMRIFIG